MRRFEFSEGTSDKFWQIACEDTSVRVQFGRIGTVGQTQLKAFASAEAARTEADKLVKEKTKKGYVEVVDGAFAPSAEAAAAPATAAKPAQATKATSAPAKATKSAAVAAPAAPAVPPPAPVAVAPAAPVVTAPPALPSAPASTSSVTPITALSDAALREVAPSRLSSLVPARAPDAKALYARLAKAMTAAAPLLELGAKRGKPNKALMEKAQQAFASPSRPAALELEAQAAACALIGPMVAYGDDSGRTDDFVRYWYAVGGAAFALQAYARSSELHVDANDKSLAIVDSPPQEMPWWRKRQVHGWRGLRTVAVLANDAEQGELLKEAEALALTGSPATRATLAAAFERPAWAEADVSSMTTGDAAPAWLWPLVVSVASIDEAKVLIARAKVVHVWHLLHAITDLRFDLVARYGLGAATIFGELIEQSGTYGVDQMRSFAEAMAMVVAPPVAEFFAKQLGTKDLRAVAAAYLQSHPQIGVVPLAQAAVGKGALADAARAVLKPIVASGVPAIAEAKGALTGAALSVIAQLEEATRPREEAALEALPRVLQAPPWVTKARPAASVVVELTPLPFEESMAWKAGEPNSWISRWHQGQETPEAIAKNVADIRKAAATKATPGERRWDMQNAAAFASLPKDVLLELGAQVDFSRFNWGYAQVARHVMARHGVDAIGFVMRSASEDSHNAVLALLRANSARVAPMMADAFYRLKKLKDDAAGWLLSFPEAAAVGLLPQAIGKPGKARDAAEASLRFLAARGQLGVLEAVAKRYGEDAEAGLRAVLAFDALLAYPAKLPKLPAYWSAGAFARPLLAGGTHALPAGAVDTIGTMLAFTSFDEPYPGLLDVREACDPRSLAEFGWDLFQAWIVAGAPAKEAWAFQALSLFGDDDTARKLTPLVRTWPGEAAHARAVVGLDVLAKIGSDVALMHLHGIAQKLKFKGLQEKAREKIDQIAEARGLSAEELADRLVPDLGLDERGSLDLDFGARRFKVVFDESLKPAVLDDTGKRLPDLPKPKQTDDPEKAGAATELWKALKKDAKTIASGQILRLEIAMCAQRRWTTPVFQQFLVEHPLLIHVVRRLVWGTYAADESLVAAFRVAEDGTLADAKDDAFELPADARVGIVHRLDLDESTAAAFGQIFADYEVLQPFVQLSRETASPTPEERESKKLERVVGLKVPTGKVLGLDNRGWRRGPPQDGGVVCWYEKAMLGGLVACLDLDPGIFTGMIAEAPEQTLGVVTLSDGERRWGVEEAQPFGRLSPIAFSELLRDLDALRP
jgi:predicted DNA-binding WGR domain protein